MSNDLKTEAVQKDTLDRQKFEATWNACVAEFPDAKAANVEMGSPAWQTFMLDAQAAHIIRLKIQIAVLENFYLQLPKDAVSPIDCKRCEGHGVYDGKDEQGNGYEFECGDCEGTGRIKGVEPLTFAYRNYRGEVAERRVIPKAIWHGSTQYHTEPQWLMTALDLDKQSDRDFAMRDMQPSGATSRPDKWLIWSNEHRAWWGPDSSGYRGIISHAGRYSFEEASAICKDGGRQRAWSESKGPFEVMVPAPECLAPKGGA